MSRTLGATTLSHLPDPYVIPVWFAELHYDTGTVYYHNDIGDIVALGHTWTGLGTFGEIDPIEETEKIESSSVKLRLSGLDTTSMDQALIRDYKGRVAIIYWALCNEVLGGLYDNPAIQFYGSIDVMAVRYSGDEASIEVTLESESAEWFRTSGEMYSDSQLQKEHPGDLFFEYLDQMPDVAIHWVKAQTVRFGSGPTGGGGSFLPRFPTNV